MKILLGLSGGVDSTYAALKLKNEGHDVEGAVVLMHSYTDISGAERSSAELGIKLHVIDATEAFEQKVCQGFVSEYVKGRTPNPCVVCNREVKIRYLYDYAVKNGFDKIATGHYAEVRKLEGRSGVRYCVAAARDAKKDQSYMLSRLGQDLLSRLILPMSEEIKSDIYAIAKERGLSSAGKAESQEICFITSGSYTDYIEERAGKSVPGDFLDSSGRVLGRHKGIIHYTVGQRKGLEIALGQRMFVNRINAEDNTVILDSAPALSNRVEIEDIIFSGIEPPIEDMRLTLTVKLRYLARPVSCEAFVRPDRTAGVLLHEPVGSVTPGQTAVFYSSEGVAFSGFIADSSFENQ